MLTACRTLPTRHQAILATTRRFYSSSYHGRSNDGSSSSSSSSSSSNNNSKSEQEQEIPPTDKSNVQQHETEQQKSQQQHLSFMPVINMPESEFAHNAFFSLHRPLLGLSSSEERPFFSTRNHPSPPNAAIREMLGITEPHDHEEADEALAQYMMQLRPFEPPQQDGEYRGEMEVRFDEALHIDQHLPTYYMPESDQVVDYLTAMQEKLEQQDQQLGRKRGASRPVVYAMTASEARRKSMHIQQYRQRAKRQRPIARLLIDRRNR